MINKICKAFCLLTILLCADYHTGWAGDSFYKNFPPRKIFQEGKTSLLKALKAIESHYDVRFVYQKKFVSGKVIDGPLLLDQPVEKLLEQLLFPLDLRFERTAGNTFVILPQRSNTALAQARDGSTLPNEPAIKNRSKGPAGAPITGIVLDELGKPLPNVSILEHGSSNGVFSNSKGEFFLYPATVSGALHISYVGYKSVEVEYNGNSNLTIQMTQDVKMSEEIVVIAYGSRAKKDLTGAVSQITSQDITKTVALSPQMAMLGRMPGVYVTSPGGDPNSAPIVRVRGVTTFSGRSADPLYVIDGVIIDEYGSRSTFSLNAQKAEDVRGTQNILNLINPADIESISVLKDASSAAAYGARAANGVVLITTKRGREGRARLNFNASAGVSNVLKTLPVLDTKQYVDIVNEANQGNPDFNDRKYDIYKNGQPAYLGNNGTYDWQSAIVNENASFNNYDLSISGGSKTANYYIGAGYTSQESSLKFNKQDRYTLSTRTEFKINKLIEIGQTLRLAYTDMEDNRNNTGVPVSLTEVFTTPPWQPIYGNGPNGFAAVGVSQYGPETKQNFLGVGSVTSKQSDIYKMLGNGYITLTPLNNLQITGSVGADYFTQRELQWARRSLNDFEKSLNNGNRIGEIRTTNFLLQKRLSINYRTAIAGRHYIDAYMHAEDQKSTFNSLIAGRSQITDVDDPNLFSVNGPGASTDAYKDHNSFINYLGRLSYKYLDRYYLDINLLRQGSSVFNPNGYQWGNFPSIAAAWRIGKETFMQSVSLSDLRFKFGVGQLGNSDTKGWQYLTLVSNTNAAYTVGGTPVLGAFFTNYPNHNLTWEKVSTFNIGAEGSFFDNRLAFSIEYYKRITSKILQPYRLPASVGITEFPFKNIGAAENSGIELSFNYANNKNRLQYSIGGNITTTRNRVTKLNDNVPVSTPAGLVVLGDPINSIYGFISDGVIQDEHELNEYKKLYAGSPLVQQLQPGDLKYVDIGGAPEPEDQKAGIRYRPIPDGKIDDYDGLAYLGKTIPGYFFGINLSAQFHGFDLYALLQGVGDVRKQNEVLWNGLSYGFRNKLSLVQDRWTPSNTNTNIPRAINYGAASVNNLRYSDRFVEDASFFRLANFQIGYSIGEKQLKTLKYLERCRFYISASNLFLITDYSGLDPENDGVPTPRTIVLGCNLSF